MKHTWNPTPLPRYWTTSARADETTRRYERRYWLSSADFYDLYQQGLLDDGEHTEDFAVWAAFYEIKQEREGTLQQLSQERKKKLCRQYREGAIQINPREPVIGG